MTPQHLATAENQVKVVQFLIERDGPVGRRGFGSDYAVNLPFVYADTSLSALRRSADHPIAPD